MPKVRVAIPSSTAAAVLFDSDHTCCKCRDAGRPVQLHHIDEDPSNNDAANLAVLCLLCHDETQRSGGFGRHLSSDLMHKYKDDWTTRVAVRRDKADVIAAYAMTRQSTSRPQTVDLETSAFDNARDSYIASLPASLASAYAIAQPRWDTGVTSEMIEATIGVIDVVIQLLVHLGERFPTNHFEGKSAAQYFSEYTSARYRWHRLLIEPEGVGTGGTIVGPLTALAVLKSLEQSVEDMVSAQASPEDGIDHPRWLAAWRDHDGN